MQWLALKGKRTNHSPRAKTSTRRVELGVRGKMLMSRRVIVRWRPCIAIDGLQNSNKSWYRMSCDKNSNEPTSKRLCGSIEEEASTSARWSTVILSECTLHMENFIN